MGRTRRRHKVSTLISGDGEDGKVENIPENICNVNLIKAAEEDPLEIIVPELERSQGRRGGFVTRTIKLSWGIIPD